MAAWLSPVLGLQPVSAMHISICRDLLQGGPSKAKDLLQQSREGSAAGRAAWLPASCLLPARCLLAQQLIQSREPT